MIAEHPFAQYVRILGKGKTGSRSLNADEAYAAMGMIMRGEVEDVQLGAFLMLLRVKEESCEELAGFVRAIRETLNAPVIAADLDWASYAGKRRQQPWYLLAALALADSGLRVFMHGAAGHTVDRVYSGQVLNALGERCGSWLAGCQREARQSQLCLYAVRGLLFAPAAHDRSALAVWPAVTSTHLISAASSTGSGLLNTKYFPPCLC